MPYRISILDREDNVYPNAQKQSDPILDYATFGAITSKVDQPTCGESSSLKSLVVVFLFFLY